MKDEKKVSDIIDKVQLYLERQGVHSELCRIYLRKIEHLYYKFDSNVLKQKQVRKNEILKLKKEFKLLILNNYYK